MNKTLQFARILVAKFPGLLTVNVSLLVVASVLDAAAVFSIAPVVDVLINSESESTSGVTRAVVGVFSEVGIAATLTNLLLAFLGFNLLRSIFLIITQYFLQRTKYAVYRDLMFNAFDDLFRAGWYFFTNRRHGGVLNTFLREANIAGDAFGAMGQILASLVQTTLFVAVPFYVSWKVTILCLGAACLFAVPFGLLGRVSFRLGQDTTDTANEVGSVSHECLAAAKVIIGFGKQQHHVEKFKEALDNHIRAAQRSQTFIIGLPISYYPFGMSVFAVALVASRYYSVPLSDTAVVLYSLLKVIPAIQGFVGQKSRLDNSYPSYKQVTNLGRQAQEMRQPSGLRRFSGLCREIMVRDVSFAYPGNDLVLSDLQMRITKGTMVAIVGESGSGKSTFADLVMRFYDPTAGRIEIDGVPLVDLNVNDYRNRLGYVPQDSFIFDSSVRDNLLWANKVATDEDLHYACDQANARQFIEELPGGYDTVLGERGIRLSGGQIQRLALARAVLRKPDILILDEATSSLDTHSERLIQAALEQITKTATLIIIAHRLSTIANADYIYVLKDTRIIEEGTYAELLSLEGTFAKMVQLQKLETVSSP